MRESRNEIKRENRKTTISLAAGWENTAITEGGGLTHGSCVVGLQAIGDIWKFWSHTHAM